MGLKAYVYRVKGIRLQGKGIRLQGKGIRLQGKGSCVVDIRCGTGIP